MNRTLDYPEHLQYHVTSSHMFKTQREREREGEREKGTEKEREIQNERTDRQQITASSCTTHSTPTPIY